MVPYCLFQPLLCLKYNQNASVKAKFFTPTAGFPSFLFGCEGSIQVKPRLGVKEAPDRCVTDGVEIEEVSVKNRCSSGV